MAKLIRNIQFCITLNSPEVYFYYQQEVQKRFCMLPSTKSLGKMNVEASLWPNSFATF